VAGDPTVTYTFVGDVQQNPGDESLVIDSPNYYGVNCAAYTDLVNVFGGGLAETQLWATAHNYCNTDGYTPGEGAVQAFNANLQAGPDETVAPNFGQWYGSFASGANILTGNFQLCSEDPVGSHTNYACVAWTAGPFE
jgi:hypothetical protein